MNHLRGRTIWECERCQTRAWGRKHEPPPACKACGYLDFTEADEDDVRDAIDCENYHEREDEKLMRKYGFRIVPEP